MSIKIVLKPEDNDSTLATKHGIFMLIFIFGLST